DQQSSDTGEADVAADNDSNGQQDSGERNNADTEGPDRASGDVDHESNGQANDERQDADADDPAEASGAVGAGAEANGNGEADQREPEQQLLEMSADLRELRPRPEQRSLARQADQREPGSARARKSPGR